jgi:hypothetical protein
MREEEVPLMALVVLKEERPTAARWPSPDAEQHAFGLPNLHNCEINELLFFINYPVSGVLLLQ